MRRGRGWANGLPADHHHRRDPARPLRHVPRRGRPRGHDRLRCVGGPPCAGWWYLHRPGQQSRGLRRGAGPARVAGGARGDAAANAGGQGVAELMAAETQAQVTLTPAEAVTQHLRDWCPNKARAMYAPNVARALGMSERSMRDAAGQARDAGAPIAPPPALGFWYARAEARASACRLGRRALRMLHRSRKMLEACALPGQEPLLDVLPDLLARLDAAMPANTSPQGSEDHVVETPETRDSTSAVPADGPDCSGLPVAAGPDGRKASGGRGAPQLTLIESGFGDCGDDVDRPADHAAGR